MGELQHLRAEGVQMDKAGGAVVGAGHADLSLEGLGERVAGRG
jgi:hypothetical protein